MGAILGVDAIHELRKEDFLDAINQGYEAMKFIEIAKRKAQFFVDSQLGDGLWLYWRCSDCLKCTWSTIVYR